jgi:hypothetical protein
LRLLKLKLCAWQAIIGSTQPAFPLFPPIAARTNSFDFVQGASELCWWRLNRTSLDEYRPAW